MCPNNINYSLFLMSRRVDLLKEYQVLNLSGRRRGTARFARCSIRHVSVRQHLLQWPQIRSRVSGRWRSTPARVPARRGAGWRMLGRAALGSGCACSQVSRGHYSFAALRGRNGYRRHASEHNIDYSVVWCLIRDRDTRTGNSRNL